MKIKYIFFLLILSQTLLSQDNNQELILDTVMEKFFLNYSVLSPVTNHVSFARKKDGYYVVKIENLIREVASEKFCDLEAETFFDITLFSKKKIPLNDSTSTIYQESESFVYDNKAKINQIKSSKPYFYEELIFPYYGYSGFYNDVIDLYSKQEKLSPDNLYCLCKAHSYKLSSIMYKNYPYSLDNDKIWQIDSTKLKQRDLQKFLKVSNDERNCYRRLKDSFPNYETNRGDSKEKYGHIVIHSFIKLLINSSEEDARKVLEPNLYNDEILSESKRILSSCSENSVLYTWGELDTYPLYYLQAIEGYRDDVVIINVSLIPLPKYLKLVYSGPFEAQKIETSIPEYSLTRTTVFYSNSSPGSEPNIAAKDFFLKLSNKSSYIKSEFETNNFYLNTNKVILKSNANGENLDNALFIKLPPYYFIDIVTQIDILHSNMSKRKIYFTKAFPSDYYQKYSNLKEGDFTYELTN